MVHRTRKIARQRPESSQPDQAERVAETMLASMATEQNHSRGRAVRSSATALTFPPPRKVQSASAAPAQIARAFAAGLDSIGSGHGCALALVRHTQSRLRTLNR